MINSKICRFYLEFIEFIKNLLKEEFTQELTRRGQMIYKLVRVNELIGKFDNITIKHMTKSQIFL